MNDEIIPYIIEKEIPQVGIFSAQILSYGPYVRNLRVPVRLGEIREVVLGYLKIFRYPRLMPGRNYRCVEKEENRIVFENPKEGRVSYELTQDSLIVEGSRIPSMYVNLMGHGVLNIFDHRLTIAGTSYVEPRGKVTAMAEDRDILDRDGIHPLDFTTSRLIGDRIRVGHPELTRHHGYDSVYVVDRNRMRSPDTTRETPSAAGAIGQNTVDETQSAANEIGQNTIGENLFTAGAIGQNTIDENLFTAGVIGQNTIGETPSISGVSVHGEPSVGEAVHEKAMLSGPPQASVTDFYYGLSMEVRSTADRIRFETANDFSGRELGRGGCLYQPHGGLMLTPVATEELPVNTGSISSQEKTGLPSESAEMQETGSAAARSRNAEGIPGIRAEYRFRTDI